MALRAWLRGEPGEKQVAALLEYAGDRDAPLQTTDVDCAEANSRGRAQKRRALANAAAALKSHLKISLADAFAAARAKERKTKLVTGKNKFRASGKEVKIAGLKNQ